MGHVGPSIPEFIKDFQKKRKEIKRWSIGPNQSLIYKEPLLQPEHKKEIIGYTVLLVAIIVYSVWEIYR